MSKSTKDNRIIDEYVSALDRVSEFLGNLLMTKGIVNYITNNKGKLILVYLLVISLLTMYGVWDRGHFVNCDDVKANNLPEYIDTIEELAEFYKNKHYVPYTNVFTTVYFKDLVIPLIMGIFQGILFISIFYIFYKLYKFIIKKIYTYSVNKFK